LRQRFGGYSASDSEGRGVFDLTKPTLAETFELTEQTARLRSVTGLRKTSLIGC
jgi:hypothetical protein